MLKAGSIVYAIFVSLIFSVLSSSFIVTTYLNRRINADLDIQFELRRHAESGLHLLLLEDSDIPYGPSVDIQLFPDDPQEVRLKRIPWGAYEVVSSTASKNKFEHQITALTGINNNEDAPIALYLQERNQPLSLCGKTLIVGDCYLPKSGVKRAYVEGKNFVGDKLIHGKVRTITNDFPQLSKHFRNDGNWNQLDVDLETIEIHFDDLEVDSVHNSFDSITQVIHSDESINLTGHYSGNVIVKSNSLIIVSGDANLKNILVAAPQIEIEQGFNGTAQFIASDSIITEENCTFHYPSSLVIHSENPNSSEGIVLGRNSHLFGCVILYRKYYDRRNRSILTINPESKITGQVYCNDAVNLRGTIEGNLICSRFVLRTQSSIYENHLLDATIDLSALSKDFVGNSFFSELGNKKIIQWLN